MDTNTTPAHTETTQPETGGRALTRPRRGRIVAGVAAGLADYFGVSTGLVRLLFAVTPFFGGLGIVVYVAGWLLIPSDDEAQSIAERLAEDWRR